MTRPLSVGLILLVAAACSHSKPEPEPAPAVAEQPPAPATRVIRDTVRVRDSDIDQQLSRLQIKLLEKDAQIEDLQSRLETAQQDVVRTLARSQTTASRAEAASGIAEAETSLQAPGGAASPNLAQARRNLKLATEAFNQENYGGALYLANEAKALVSSGRTPAAGKERLARGEKSFASPVRLTPTTRCNVREGPGPRFKVLFTLQQGAALTGLSYTDTWIRVSDDTGRTGWVSRSLVGPRK